MNQSELLKSIRKLVKYHRDCGIGYYPGNSAILSVFSEREPKSTEGAQGAAAAGQTAPEEAGPSTVLKPDPGPQRSDSMVELTRQVADCALCPLHLSRQSDTAGRGGDAPLLLVVGDWLVMEEGEESPGRIFGEQQDRMLERMIAAIGLTTDDVFVTNVIKCSVPGSLRPKGEHIDTCVNYLKQQIVRLSPKIICAMGPTAAQTLLATRQSLSQLRGRFHGCRLPPAAAVMVMPTYHPSYLLKNPEMKKAVWADLQVIQKELGRV